MSPIDIVLLLAAAASAEGNLVPWQNISALKSPEKQIGGSNGRHLMAHLLDPNATTRPPRDRSEGAPESYPTRYCDQCESRRPRAPAPASGPAPPPRSSEPEPTPESPITVPVALALACIIIMAAMVMLMLMSAYYDAKRIVAQRPVDSSKKPWSTGEKPPASFHIPATTSQRLECPFSKQYLMVCGHIVAGVCTIGLEWVSLAYVENTNTVHLILLLLCLFLASVGYCCCCAGCFCAEHNEDPSWGGTQACGCIMGGGFSIIATIFFLIWITAPENNRGGLYTLRFVLLPLCLIGAVIGWGLASADGICCGCTCFKVLEDPKTNRQPYEVQVHHSAPPVKVRAPVGPAVGIREGAGEGEGRQQSRQAKGERRKDSYSESSSSSRGGSEVLDFRPGAKVQIHGLHGMQGHMLNGHSAILEIFDDSSQKWRVQLTSGPYAQYDGPQGRMVCHYDLGVENLTLIDSKAAYWIKAKHHRDLYPAHHIPIAWHHDKEFSNSEVIHSWKEISKYIEKHL